MRFESIGTGLVTNNRFGEEVQLSPRESRIYLAIQSGGETVKDIARMATDEVEEISVKNVKVITHRMKRRLGVTDMRLPELVKHIRERGRME